MPLSVIEGRKPNGRYDEIQIDYSSVLAQMPFEHWMIHQGLLYYAIQRVRGSAAVRSQLIRTGSKAAHVSVYFSSGVGTPVEIYEAATVTNVGTPLARRNYNRNFPDDNTETLFYTSPTYSGGDPIRPNQSGFGSTPGQAQSGNARAGLEYDLKPNTDYVFEQAPSASTDTVMIFDFYEV
jgi:hypothetical protein